MSPWYGGVMAFLAGMVIGLFYFGGLWWTVRRMPQHRSPGAWMFTSFLVRTAASLAAFYGVMGGEWQRLLAALLGFVAVRLVLVRRIQPHTAVPGSQSAPAHGSLGPEEEERIER